MGLPGSATRCAGLIAQPQGFEVAQDSLRIRTLGDLGQGETFVVLGGQQGEEFAPGVGGIEEVAEVHLADPGGDQGKCCVDRAALHIGRIRVPAGVDVWVVGIMEDRGEVLQLLRDGAMDLDADLDAEAGCVLADLMQGPADLAERLVEIRPRGMPLGRTFTPGEPTSCARRTYSFVPSMFLRTIAGSAD